MTKLWRVGLSTALTAPRDEDEREHHPQLDRAGHREREERQRRQRHQRLRDHEQPALRRGGRRAPAPGAEEQDRARTAARR